MTHDLLTYLEQVKRRADVVLKWRSDDFGHDCQALLDAESDALTEIGEHTLRLLRIVEVLRSAIEWTAPKVHQAYHEGELANCGKSVCVEFNNALAQADAIAKEGSAG